MKQIFSKADYQRHQHLKLAASKLRNQQTLHETKLWHKIRCKQILNVHFYRQKILLNQFIVDFYAPRINLVVELDGAQHFSPDHLSNDQQRDAMLSLSGITVKRYSNFLIDTEIDSIVEDLYHFVRARLAIKNPSNGMQGRTKMHGYESTPFAHKQSL